MVTGARVKGGQNRREEGQGGEEGEGQAKGIEGRAGVGRID